VVRSVYRYCPVCAGELELRVPAHEAVEQPVCTRCGFVFYQNPKVAAGTIPVIDGGVVLLRRAIEPGRGRWVFPGGYVNQGEKVEQAAARETLEEVGLQVATGELLGIYSYTENPIIIIVFEVANLRGKLQPGPEAEAVQAFAPAEIPWGELAFPSTRDALLDWVRKHRPGLLPPGTFPATPQAH